MKIIKYNFCTKLNNVETLYTVEMPWSEANEMIAKAESYNGEYIIENDEVKNVIEPTQLDVIEAQITYTAMMTNTLLGV